MRQRWTHKNILVIFLSINFGLLHTVPRKFSGPPCTLHVTFPYIYKGVTVAVNCKKKCEFCSESPARVITVLTHLVQVKVQKFKVL